MVLEASTSHAVNDNDIPGAVKCRMWKSYCCIPQCHNNNRKNPELSFHKIQKNANLKKKWIQLLKRKGVREPGPSHRVCSAHFAEGKKTYSNNIPTVFSTSSNTPRKSHAPRIHEAIQFQSPKQHHQLVHRH